MEIAAILGIVNLLTAAITRILAEAKGEGVDVEALIAKYDEAHAAAMAYSPKDQPEA